MRSLHIPLPQVDLARTFTDFGLDLCLCDVDTVWINGKWAGWAACTRRWPTLCTHAQMQRARRVSAPPAAQPVHVANAPCRQPVRCVHSMCIARCCPRPPADPTEYFERYPQAHILASSDDLDPQNGKGDDGLEKIEAIHSAMNIGGCRLCRPLDARRAAVHSRRHRQFAPRRSQQLQER